MGSSTKSGLSTTKTATSGKNPPSLESLQLRLEVLTRKEKDSQSGHEFYLSMWKSAPYAVVALIPATIYTYLADHALAIGPLGAALMVSGIGYIGWRKHRSFNEEMAKVQIEAQEIAKQLERRTLKVEAEFINLRPNSQLCYYENMLFEDNIYYMQPTEFAPHLIPQLLEDMTKYDADLVQLHRRFNEAANDEYAKLMSFYEKAKARLEVYDKLAGVQGQQPQDRLPSLIQGLYYVLSGIVVTPLDVVQQGNTFPRIRVPRQGISHFVQMLFDKEDASNPYPALLREVSLKADAVELENARKKALEIYTVIDHITRVKYGEIPGYQPGISR